MNSKDEKRLVLEQLLRREQIANEVQQQLDQRVVGDELDPLAGIDPAVREAAEDEFYAARGRKRYRTSDGRTLFLTDDEIAQRRAARERAIPGRSKRSGYVFPMADAEVRNRMISWSFNAVVVLLALVIVWVILH